ncbi:putative secreted protein [Nitrospirillum viridazoti Y2]|uniref:Outer membrane beta-barrel porin/alpha-amylase n=1 Tax=Nitrospirillum amazonense TaxID=28077 RepID=A0A560HIJ8_9PROT|nr:transporter [Nitrospirillum amazonense]EGX99817.1 putative secreted protein [Nitrospirillum amazonense Y2]TWB46275.1 hypothetical protein FBZ92_1602 [Nitrospirillum amazonense]
MLNANRVTLFVAMAAATLSLVAPTQAGAALPASQIPDLVQPSNGINLGSTSFYDGFSTLQPGVTVLGYLRENVMNSITGSDGQDSPAFKDPSIKITTAVMQISAVTPISLDGNALGFDVLLPVTRIQSHFGSGGRQLAANSTSFADLTFGPFIQFKPIIADGHPVASFRVAFDLIAPTGGFDRTKDLNQGSGYWSLNPYVAWTVLPAEGWEVSGRTQYLYNFKTDNISNAPTIPSFTFNDGQAGQVLYSSFTVSREMEKGFSAGLNGFVVEQLNNDRINGISLPDTRHRALYLGPGLHFDRLPDWGLNLNVYMPISTHNYATGPQFNVQFIRPL